MQFFKVNEEQTSAELCKSALVFVEGIHVDSQKRKHDFSSERVSRIVANTNQKVTAGERIPFQKDHKKTQEYNLGDVDSLFRTAIITKDNLPNPKHSHLLGKLGVWVDKVIVKGEEAVKNVLNKTISTISAGIDPATDSFIEISATPFPAIVGPTLFSQYSEDSFLTLTFNQETATQDMKEDNEKAFSMEEALGLGKQKEDMFKQYTKVSKALYDVLQTYYSSGENELEGKDPVKSSYEAIKFFVTEIEDIFGLVEKKKESENPIINDKSVKQDKNKLGFSKFRKQKACRKFNNRVKFR